jgi:uncharacterized membrane protein
MKLPVLSMICGILSAVAARLLLENHLVHANFGRHFVIGFCISAIGFAVCGWLTGWK